MVKLAKEKRYQDTDSEEENDCIFRNESFSKSEQCECPKYLRWAEIDAVDNQAFICDHFDNFLKIICTFVVSLFCWSGFLPHPIHSAIFTKRAINDGWFWWRTFFSS